MWLQLKLFNVTVLFAYQIWKLDFLGLSYIKLAHMI